MVTVPREWIDQGKLLLERLDLESPYLVVAAFWAKGMEEPNHSLRLRIKELESVGPNLLYKSIQKLLKKRPALDELHLEDIVLIKEQDEILVDLRVNSRGVALRNVRFTGFFQHKLLLEGDLFVYRVN